MTVFMADAAPALMPSQTPANVSVTFSQAAVHAVDIAFQASVR